MRVELVTSVPADGSVKLQWSAEPAEAMDCWWVLAVRSGSPPGCASLRLDGKTASWTFTNLGRHQPYRFMVMGQQRDQVMCSTWWNATPRRALTPAPDDGPAGVQRFLAPLHQLLLMPQDRRITAFWKLGSGFVDRVVVELWNGRTQCGRWEVEPEVRSLVMDADRVPSLQNGTTYTVRVFPRFASSSPGVIAASCTPAPQGEERQANQGHPQDPLVYACLAVGPELDAFGDQSDAAAEARPVRCGHCQGVTRWKDWALRCEQCAAEFIGNSRGDWLDVTRLRFGTCRCCLPRKVLIQDVGSTSLRCAHSGKEYIQRDGGGGFLLIEELPCGLCQCCRPRRPLVQKKGGKVVCGKSNEEHRRSQQDAASFVLIPSTPVFDAAAIDDLLDAGLADICATGVSRARR